MLACALGGACAGLAGAVEVAAVHTSANASLIAGYGYTGILVAFMARHNPLAIVPVAILFGGFGAAGSLLQRRLGLPDASGAGAAGHCLRAHPGQRGAARPDQGLAGQLFKLRRCPCRPGVDGGQDQHDRMWFDVLRRHAGRRLRVGTPFLFVSLGECLTEKAGRINLGLEGVLVLSAMAALAAPATSPAGGWACWPPGSVRALAPCCTACCAAAAGQRHGHRHRADAAGRGLAFYLGKPLIQPQAPQIPAIPLGNWSDSPAPSVGAADQRAVPLGVALALALAWAFARTRWGLTVRMVGDSADAARALGTSVNGVRIAATTAGGFIAGLGGASLSLYYPGSWNEALSSGQGLIAVALVIFARWQPVRCIGRRPCCSAAPARSARPCSRWASATTTCSTPCPMC
jgi:ABC-type uncharacterized transport system permease subunit